MTLKLDYKIAGAKLLRLSLELKDGCVERLIIAGDFFAFPEELFEACEAKCSGLRFDEQCAQSIQKIFSLEALQLSGISAEHIGLAINIIYTENSGTLCK